MKPKLEEELSKL